MYFFFSPLNLPIWLKRYSLQFAVGMDNTPPQTDSLEHMGTMCQTNLHIPHAAVLSLSWSWSCSKTATHSRNPTNPYTLPIWGAVPLLPSLWYSFAFCFSSWLKKKKFTTPWSCLSKVPTPFRSLNLKRCLIWQLEPLNWQFVFPQKYKERQGEKKSEKTQSLVIFMLGIDARK